jgi:hypothetical protein
MGVFRTKAREVEVPASGNVENWTDKDAHVEVTGVRAGRGRCECIAGLLPSARTPHDEDLCNAEAPGFLMRVALRAKVDLPPDELYAVLTAPDNASIFKGIKVRRMQLHT